MPDIKKKLRLFEINICCVFLVLGLHLTRDSAHHLDVQEIIASYDSRKHFRRLFLPID